MKTYLICVFCFVVLGGGVAANAQEKIYPDMFPLKDVQLLNGPFKHARDLNVRVLLKYDVDRLLAPNRKEAGLMAKAKGYPNWEGLDGHVGGHYLSALAMTVAATNNPDCKKRMEYMIRELKQCQDSNAVNNPEWGIGYAGGMPNSKAIFSKLKKGDFSTYFSSWAPWYNLHKTYAGLRDAWLYAHNEDARAIFLKYCDWGIALTAGLTDAQMETMLGAEHGGMDESYADAYQMTGDEKYLVMAKRFSHRMLLEPMAARKDILDNKHANTQIPKVTGFQRIAELSHDDTYGTAAAFFWDTVIKNRTLVFGGNSRKEHFPATTSCTDYIDDVEGPETCNSYNMLKLTEDLFRVTPAGKYMDYYERTLYNHILSSQHPEHGGYVYFTPARPRHYRVYSAPNQAMWCCVGSGMENHAKYNQMIYTHRGDSLYVNLFIASEVNWKEKGVTIRQETAFPSEERTRIKILKGTAQFPLMIRYPSWVKAGELTLVVNGKPLPYTVQPSAYVALNRIWKKGDVVEIRMPMHNSIERVPNVPSYVAFLHGPILLGAKTGTEELTGLVADDGRWGQTAAGRKLPLDKAPIIIEDDASKIAAALVPVKGKPLSYTVPSLKMANAMPVMLEPFYQIHDARYMMYWMALSTTQYTSYLDSLAGIEQAKLALDNRTIDKVAPGEQQPETDHALQSANSRTGNNQGEFWREAGHGGYFSYVLATKGNTDVTLQVRYWGYEWGDRTFDIYIDSEKLVTEKNTGRWFQARFQTVDYTIPKAMVEGKDQIRVKFQAHERNTAGAVYSVRLLKKN